MPVEARPPIAAYSNSLAENQESWGSGMNPETLFLTLPTQVAGAATRLTTTYWSLAFIAFKRLRLEASRTELSAGK